jgi:hypothetical protein
MSDSKGAGARVSASRESRDQRGLANADEAKPARRRVTLAAMEASTEDEGSGFAAAVRAQRRPCYRADRFFETCAMGSGAVVPPTKLHGFTWR